MKVRNFAFFGVMASILGISAANAASDTVIASQAYVDAVANTKQPTLQNTHITDNQTGQFITDITATNGQITVTRGNAVTDLTDYETSQHASSTYQPIISDLATIRSNAENAQKASDSKVAENGNYIEAGNAVGTNLTKLDTELKKKANADDVYTKSNVYTKTETDSAISTATSGLETTTHASSTYQPIISDLATIRSNAENAQKASDSKVAFAEGESGYKITAGNKVGDNLVALDKELKNVASTANKQADWNQTNTDAVDFIKNKPTVDQTYSATSQNAQSGTAVASAISGINTTATTAVQGVNATVSGNGEAVTSISENSTTHDLDLTKNYLSYNGAMRYELPNYSTGGNWTDEGCNAENPCVLTIVGMDSNGRPDYKWTQMAL